MPAESGISNILEWKLQEVEVDRRSAVTHMKALAASIAAVPHRAGLDLARDEEGERRPAKPRCPRTGSRKAKRNPP